MKRLAVLMAAAFSPVALLANRLPPITATQAQEYYELVVSGLTDAGEYVQVSLGPIYGLPEMTDEEVMEYMGKATWFEKDSFLDRVIDRFELFDGHKLIFQGPTTAGVIPKGWTNLVPAGRL